jgi:hypothetical protein
MPVGGRRRDAAAAPPTPADILHSLREQHDMQPIVDEWGKDLLRISGLPNLDALRDKLAPLGEYTLRGVMSPLQGLTQMGKPVPFNETSVMDAYALFKATPVLHPELFDAERAREYSEELRLKQEKQEREATARALWEKAEAQGFTTAALAAVPDWVKKIYLGDGWRREEEHIGKYEDTHFPLRMQAKAEEEARQEAERTRAEKGVTFSDLGKGLLGLPKELGKAVSEVGKGVSALPSTTRQVLSEVGGGLSQELLGGDEKKRKFGLFGPSYDSHGQPRTETMLEQGARHHPMWAKILSTMIAPTAGTLFGGPLGAVLGGAGYGGLEHGRRGIVPGAMKGATYAAVAPTLAEKLGADPSGIFGRLTGLDSPSLLHQLGVRGAPPTGGGIGLWGNLGQTGLADPYLSHSTFSDAKDLFKLGTEINDIVRARKQLAKEYPGGISEQHIPGRFEGSKFKPHHFSQERFRTTPVAGPIRSPLEELMQYLPFQQKPTKSIHERSLKGTALDFRHPSIYEQIKKRALPKPVTHAPRKPFSVGGYVHGHSGGTTDDVPTNLPAGSYVMDATTVSLLGDGNSINGAKKLDEFRNRFIHSGVTDFDDSQHNIKALVSDGEYIMPKPVVDALGKGDNKRGAKALDVMRDNLRKQKGVKKFLPPKAKPLEKYIRS